MREAGFDYSTLCIVACRVAIPKPHDKVKLAQGAIASPTGPKALIWGVAALHATILCAEFWPK